jgi:two-component system, sensor histidine kinase
MDHETKSEGGQDLPPRPLDGLRLLAVEDHTIGRILLEAMLGPLGVEATVVADGAAAREAAGGERFAVVLVDLGLPDIPGERLAGELARLPGTRDAVFVAVTGRARPAELPTVFADWLEKPFSVRELHGRLRALTTPRALSA